MNTMRRLITLFESNDLSSEDLKDLNIELVKRNSYNSLRQYDRTRDMWRDSYFYKNIEYDDFMKYVKQVYKDTWEIKFDFNSRYCISIFNHGPPYDYDDYQAQWNSGGDSVQSAPKGEIRIYTPRS